MAMRRRQVKPSYQELEVLRAEQEALSNALREQIQALEAERDQALRGLELLTEALRHSGCCDPNARAGSP